MYHPTSRVLTVLELLQAHPRLTAGQIAARLEVEPRTVRRYIQQLLDMGIPIESEPGRYGGYALRPGYRMPPLILTSDEALAIAFGLAVVRQMNLAPSASAVEGATAKLSRTLPDPLHGDLDAMQRAITFNLAASDAIPNPAIGTLRDAILHRQQVALEYRTGNEQTARTVDPYRIIFHAGRWYLVGYCHLRGAMRTFRVDKIAHADRCDSTFAPLQDFDPLDFMLKSFAAISDRWDIEVVLLTTLAEAQAVIPIGPALLEEHPEGVLLRASMPNLDDMARTLVGYGFRMRVIRPDELRTTLHALADELGAL